MNSRFANQAQHSFRSPTWRRLVQRVFRGIVASRLQETRQAFNETLVGFTWFASSLPETRHAFKRRVNPSRDTSSLPETRQVIKRRVKDVERRVKPSKDASRLQDTDHSAIVPQLARSCGCGARPYHSIVSHETTCSIPTDYILRIVSGMMYRASMLNSFSLTTRIVTATKAIKIDQHQSKMTEQEKKQHSFCNRSITLSG